MSVDFRGNQVDTNILQDYKYILWIDEYFCASCYKEYKGEKILIIVNDRFNDKKGRFIQKRHLNNLLPKAEVLFLKKGYSFGDIKKYIVKKLK